jgi:hypothetical protein
MILSAAHAVAAGPVVALQKIKGKKYLKFLFRFIGNVIALLT